MRPLKRRVSDRSAIHALVNVVVHIAVKYPDVLADHSAELRQLELYAGFGDDPWGIEDASREGGNAALSSPAQCEPSREEDEDASR